MFGKSKDKVEEPPVENENENESKEEVKEPRPLSTTLLLLISNREKASDEYDKAEKAEKTYRLNKRATLGRQGWKDTKMHFRECFSHFKLAWKGLFSAIGAIPSIISDRRQQRKQKSDGKRREKILERQKRLQEALDKAEVDGEVTEEVKEGEDAAK